MALAKPYIHDSDMLGVDARCPRWLHCVVCSVVMCLACML